MEIAISAIGWIGIIAVMFMQQRTWSKERIEMLNRIQAPEYAVAESIKAPKARISVVDEKKEYELQEGKNGSS